MKKIIVGLVVGVSIAIPATTLAVQDRQTGRFVFASGCGSSYNGDRGCSVYVDKYVDGDVVCYVAVGGSNGDASSISCIKRHP